MKNYGKEKKPSDKLKLSPVSILTATLSLLPHFSNQDYIFNVNLP